MVFENLLNIKHGTVDGFDNVATLIVEQNVLNNQGVLHGGAAAGACMAAMKQATASDTKLVEMTVEYPSPGLPDDELLATATTLRSGKTYDFVHANLKSDAGIVASASGLFFHGDRTGLSPDVGFTSQVRPGQPDFELMRHDSNKGFTGDDTALRQIFDITPYSDLVFAKKGNLCFELQTSSVFSDDNGMLCDALFFILADDVAGAVAVSLGYYCVTVKLTVRFYEDVTAGKPLICTAQVDLESERTCFASGSIFSEGKLVCSCNGVFCKLGPSQSR